MFRLLVNHAEEGLKSEDNHKLLINMEHRLYKIITVPALMVTWLAGLSMIALNPALAKGGWFHVKFLMVILLTLVTVKSKKIHLGFKENRQGPSGKALRYWNEVPTLLMIVIVIMAVMKPF